MNKPLIKTQIQPELYGPLLDKKRNAPRRQAFLNRAPRPTLLAGQILWDWSPHVMLSALALVVGVVYVLLFGSDLLVGWPFHRATIGYSVVSVINGAIVTLLAWNLLRDSRRPRIEWN